MEVHSDNLQSGTQSWTCSAPFVQLCPGGIRGKFLCKAGVMDSLWFKDCGQIAWGGKEKVPGRLKPEAVKKGLETGSLSDC